MRRGFVIGILIILFISCSGCSDYIKSGCSSSSSNQGTVTQTIAQKYSVGDIVKKSPEDSQGRVILNINPYQRTYEWRSIIYDKYGRLLYYENERGTVNSTLFETEYPYKTGHIDNPYGLSELDTEYDQDYKAGDIITEENKPLEGLLILDYDYTGDAYTYCYASRRTGEWVYNTAESYKRDRISIEEKYTERVASVKI